MPAFAALWQIAQLHRPETERRYNDRLSLDLAAAVPETVCTATILARRGAQGGDLVGSR
ncbi:hypothetical protein [Mycobacterium simiae]|uniref:hypothetical protein n=1 Tax=Mycobacterium simiae TaxID=1784 RepID=UPI001593308D|nr:hypothetical protein [Mycobacterium simiae]